ncbi:hypothetical protein IVB18_20220 [Bradyrhizobium sp. 186]|uniref:hypothetical protein n=1 Tax=Bradyrhizobium sp. 186 TaxID=2782654 RepID=UPI0020007DCE|nr:hypothetical protein [Bradyrhizobium sp. 186]UPK40765.1 hypothetical protein IVB18_20220 [Bradyrhizobium sp. 186]
MIDVTAVAVGTRLKLQNGIVAEVTENMEDGQWLQVRYLESPGRPLWSFRRLSIWSESRKLRLRSLSVRRRDSENRQPAARSDAA